MWRDFALEELHGLLCAGQDPVLGEHLVVGVVAGLGEHALDDHVVGHRGLRLCDRRGVVSQPVEGVGQLLAEQTQVARRVEPREVVVGPGHLAEEPAERLDVLGLLPEEGGQVHLLLEPSLRGDHHDQRQQIERHGLLTTGEQRRQVEQDLALERDEACPVVDVPRQVDGGGIPGAELLRLLPQGHRQPLEVEPATPGDGV